MGIEAEQAVNLIELIKVTGPYVVAVAGMAFGFIQSTRLAEITKDQYIHISKLQQESVLSLEKYKTQITATFRLQEIYSSMYAKIETIFQNYIGLVLDESNASNINNGLNKFVMNDYISMTVEKRKGKERTAISFCVF